MDETLRQLGELLLGSIPTIIMLVLLYAFYSVVVHTPLSRVLAERRARTEGAIEKARVDVAAAEAKTAEYEQRLRDARMALFKSQEAGRQAGLVRAASSRPSSSPGSSARPQACLRSKYRASVGALSVRRAKWCPRCATST